MVSNPPPTVNERITGSLTWLSVMDDPALLAEEIRVELQGAT